MKREKLFQALALATDAYCEIPTGEDVTVLNSKETGVQCYIRKAPGGTLLITFRGSNEPKDWEKNLTFWKKTMPYGNTHSPIRVHKGFITAYRHHTVRSILHAQVTPDVKTIVVCGHSYGAALSILCALDLEYNFPRKEYEVYLFGCPRIGNKTFMRSYNKRVHNTIRVENGNDIVTKIPFGWMGYYHVGAKMHIGPLRIPGVFCPSHHWQVAYYQSLLKRLL